MTEKYSVVLASATLPADVRNHISALSSAELLRAAVTGYVYKPGAWLERSAGTIDSMLGTHLNGALRRRRELAGVDATRIHRQILLDLWHSWRSKDYNGRDAVRHIDRSMSAVDRQASRLLSPRDSLIIGRDDVALDSYEVARRLGVSCLHQLPIAHFAMVNRIMQAEYDAFPNVSAEPPPSDVLTPQRCARKKAEIEAADHILVPSEFVRNSLLEVGISSDRIKVLPFGCEAEWMSERPSKRGNVFLHVGRLSLRKGTHRLLRAWKALGAHRTYRLVLIGSMHLHEAFLRDFRGCYEYLGQMPRNKLSAHYQRACCFVLPAMAEGFAVVVLEALSAGTPVVVSRNTGAEGFITSGREGLLHDAQDDESLCEALDWMLSHPDERLEMGRAALDKAHGWTWDNYQSRFIELVAQVVSSNGGRKGAPTTSHSG